MLNPIPIDSEKKSGELQRPMESGSIAMANSNGESGHPWWQARVKGKKLDCVELVLTLAI